MIVIRTLGTQPYLPIWEKMRLFTQAREEATADECWLLEHPPVYTQGLAGKAEHLLLPSAIPLVHSDRGGQITYHGPGQLIAYTLINLNRRQLGIRSLVNRLESILIELLAEFKIEGQRRCSAPGVYVAEKKIASIGLRVKNGCTYHGIALNVSMDLTPFSGINPCGYQGLQMTQLSDFIFDISMNEVLFRLENILHKYFDCHHATIF